MTDAPIKKFSVLIHYHMQDTNTRTVFADSPDLAARIALAEWREAHTERCVYPVVVSVDEAQRPGGIRVI